MIPDILFTYWEGPNLSYFNYLTILSLHTYNPTKTIIIYTSKVESQTLVAWNSNEHNIPITIRYTLSDVVSICPELIKLHPIDFSNNYQLDNNMSCVHKADIIRIIKLYEHGGVWFDFDILFIKPIPDHIFNNNYDFLYFTYKGVIPTGLLAATPNNIIIKKVYDACMYKISSLNLKPDKRKYQSYGPELWRNAILFSTKPPASQLLKNSIELDFASIYPFNCDEIEKLYQPLDNITSAGIADDAVPSTLNSKPSLSGREFNGMTVPLHWANNPVQTVLTKIKDITWGIHWYNGSPLTKNAINTFTEQKNNQPDSIINKYIIKLLDDASAEK